MSITLSPWMIPVVLTIIIWATTILWPRPKRRGDYDFSGPIVAAFQFFLAVIATLVVWLIYFMVM